jgi:ribonucleoside-diphosphate reductase alpha chain
MGLADIVLNVGRTQHKPGAKVADIVEFVEAPWGLGMRLFPVQKIILKAHYGLALDDKETFKVSDWRRVTFTDHTEKTYLEYLFKDGRSNISEVIPGIERRELILSIGRRAGKCILGDSLVLTDRGVFRIDALGDPYGPEVQPLDIGVAQEGAVQSRSRFFYNGGVKPTRTFTTHCGFRLGGTDSHRIKVMSEDGTVQWRHLADLKVGDWVAQHRATDLWASQYVDTSPFHNTLGSKELHFPDRLDERWGRLLGYLVGDGLWNYPTRTEVTVAHPETWDQLKALFTELFGGFSVAMDKRTANTGALKFYGLGMRKFLHDLGFKLGTDWDQKMVPWAVMRSPRSVVQAFLRGLFEADGGIEKAGQVVSFCSASRRLTSEVQILLLNFGIVSRVSVKLVKGRTYHILRVLGLRSRQVFAREIGSEERRVGKECRSRWSPYH